MAQKASVIVPKQGPLEALRSHSTPRLLLSSMRPHQWVKNLFVLAPLLFGKRLSDPYAVGQALLAFACFCLMSSSLYLFNDVTDAPDDRVHPEKRLRPVPSGALPIWLALTSSGVLAFIAFWIAAKLDLRFVLLAGVYSMSMLGYCLALKRAIILDTMMIAFGFVLRVLGGAIAVQVRPTHWLIACAFLLALFLAFAKRRQELLALSGSAAQHRHVLGKYTTGYLDQVNNILVGATIVCYALYTVAPETIARFGTTTLIYGTVFVIYGLLRYLFLLQNPRDGGDPARLLLRDKPILVAILGWVVFNVLVVYRQSVIAFWQ